MAVAGTATIAVVASAPVHAAGVDSHSKHEEAVVEAEAAVLQLAPTTALLDCVPTRREPRWGTSAGGDGRKRAAAQGKRPVVRASSPEQTQGQRKVAHPLEALAL